MKALKMEEKVYILATSNQGKLKEFKELFNKMGLEIQSYNLEGIEENGSTFEEMH